MKRLVLYTLNPTNGKAQDIMEQLAQEFLGTIPGTELIYGPAPHYSDREVVISNGTWVKQTSWRSKADFLRYCEHPNLIKWCENVLHGWHCLGSIKETPGERKAEFIQKVLGGGVRREDWTREKNVPDEHLLSIGERVIDYTENAELRVLPLFGWKDKLEGIRTPNYPIPWSTFIETMVAIRQVRQDFDSPDHLAEALAYAMTAAWNSAPADQAFDLDLHIEEILEALIGEQNEDIATIIRVQLWHKMKWN